MSRLGSVSVCCKASTVPMSHQAAHPSSASLLQARSLGMAIVVSVAKEHAEHFCQQVQLGASMGCAQAAADTCGLCALHWIHFFLRSCMTKVVRW